MTKFLFINLILGVVTIGAVSWGIQNHKETKSIGQIKERIKSRMNSLNPEFCITKRHRDEASSEVISDFDNYIYREYLCDFDSNKETPCFRELKSILYEKINCVSETESNFLANKVIKDILESPYIVKSLILTLGLNYLDIKGKSGAMYFMNKDNKTISYDGEVIVQNEISFIYVLLYLYHKRDEDYRKSSEMERREVEQKLKKKLGI